MVVGIVPANDCEVTVLSARGRPRKSQKEKKSQFESQERAKLTIV
jgi:hypothetical protein